jgi:eukaryotic-like serine/threonine-protein kinase
VTTPVRGVPADGAAAPMTPERWRAVDAILQQALDADPARRRGLVAELCGSDAALHAEVETLLAANVDSDEFLERPAAESLGAPDPVPLDGRLASALAGHYEIEREIARGGMATVYLARDVRHGRRVAIKVLRDEVAAAVGAERFLSEIRVTASLQHPHILPLFDSGSEGGLLWYAMPYIEGETLRSYLQRAAPLAVPEAVRLAREVADALEHAHARGIVHRDVKPENVLLQDGHALVADFGIALALEHAGVDRVTRTGVAIGTPQYMAPEQAAGARKLDARVDVYALGAVLHEMLAGESPYAAAARRPVVRNLMYEPPASLATRRGDVAPFVDAAVQRALATRPAERFASAGAFSAALATPLPVPLQGGGERGSRGRTVSARAALYAAAAMLLVGVTGGLLIARSALGRSGPAPAAAASPTFIPRFPGVVHTGDGGNLELSVVDREGRSLQTIDAERPWTPRFSPDGRRVAYGAFGQGRQSSDLWVTDLATSKTQRLTDDDDDANDPQWSPDGGALVFSASAPGGKDLRVSKLATRVSKQLASRDGTQFPSDWLPDGSALLVTEASGDGHDILVQPTDGTPARPYLATAADERSARISPDGRWVAYTSSESGRDEVYVDSYPKAGRRIVISASGGADPIWRGDGRELYYWDEGALMAVGIGTDPAGATPVRGASAVLFHSAYQVGVSTMYDVSPDGKRFVIARPR